MRTNSPFLQQLSAELSDEPVGLYAGAQKSGLWLKGTFTRRAREELKARGADTSDPPAARYRRRLRRAQSPEFGDPDQSRSALEQRKGRIQRIGQFRDTVDIFNLRYAGSVEDRVHELLSQRLEHIASLFGQLPDILEDVWIAAALGEIEKARQTVDAVPAEHPFRLRYHSIKKVDWESCARVLDAADRRAYLSQGWIGRGTS